MIKSALVGVLVAATLCGVTACGSSESSAGSAPTAPVGSTSTSAGAQSKSSGATGPAKTISSHPTTPPPVKRGLANSTQLDHCDKTPGAVKASGTVTLPADSGDSVAQVTVYWINASNGNQLASATQTLSGLTPGRSAQWHVSANVPKTSATLTCAVHSVVPGS